MEKYNQITQAQPNVFTIHLRPISELMTFSTDKLPITMTANKLIHPGKVVTPAFCNNRIEMRAMNVPSSPRAWLTN